MFEKLGKDANSYEAIFLSALNMSSPLSNDDIAVLRADIEAVTMKHEPEQPATYAAAKCGPGTFTCMGCKAVVSLLRSVVHKLGYGYEDIEGALLAVCKVLLGVAGYNRQIICPKILPAYAPHVLRIISRRVEGSPSSLEVEEACSFMALCVQERKPQKQQQEHILEDLQLLDSEVKVERPVEEDVYRVVQLADIHYDFDYEEDEAVECNLHACCRKVYSGKGKASAFGEYNCNIPRRTVGLWLKKVMELKPDIFLNSGDIPPHHLWFEKFDEHMNYTTWLADFLHTSLPGVPIYPAIGNHDVFPSNMYYVPDQDTQTFHSVMISSYPEIQSPSTQANIHNGGYYVEQLTPKLRPLTYNTNFGYEANWYNILAYAEQHYADMKQFVDETLLQAQIDGVKVIMMAHGPVGYGIVEFDDWVRQVSTKYHDVIVLHTTGHKHHDLFRTLQSSAGSWATGVQFAAPSAGTHHNINPSLRMYELDRHTGTLLDFVQYRMDFSNIGSGDEPVVSQVYRASEEYGLADMTAKSWHKLALKMLTDNDLPNKYEDNLGTGVPKKLHDSTCKQGDKSCHTARVCDVISATMQDKTSCCKNGPQIPASSARCVSDCSGVDNGSYQSCRGCDVYVTCTNQYYQEHNCKKP